MRIIASFLLLLPVLVACNLITEPGSFSMSFSWSEEPKEPIWLWLRIEERVDETTSGNILTSAGPVSYTPGEPLSMELDKVPNGTDLYLVAEVREGANDGLPILYYGISQRFTLEAGKHTHTDVPMLLVKPEAQEVVSSVVLQLNGVAPDKVGLAQMSQLTIVTESANAISVVFANDASFSANATEVALIDGDRMTCVQEERDGLTWDLCQYEPWDLLAGLEGEPSDQEYTLFARFVDRHGYESQVYRAPLVLDSLGPQVIFGALTPPIAYPGAEVFLSVSLHEALAEDEGAAVLSVFPGLPAGSTVAGPKRVGTSATYLWTLSLDADWSGGGTSYSFKIDTRDALNNPATGLDVVDENDQPLVLQIDADPPRLEPGDWQAFNSSLFGLQDAGKELSFAFVVNEANPHTVVAGDESACVGICPVVRLGNSTLGKVFRAPDLDNDSADQVGFVYRYNVQPGDFIQADSEPVVTVNWSDQAGNGMEEVVTGALRFDFARPQHLSCSLVPGFGNSDSLFTYRITASEPLAGAPTLSVDAQSEALFSQPPVSSDGGQTWEWQQPATGLPSQSFTVSARLVDGAGNVSANDENETGFVCPATAAVDGTDPVLQEGALVTTDPVVINHAGKTVLVCGEGTILQAEFSVKETNGIAKNSPDVRIAVPGQEIPLTLLDEKDLGDGLFHYVFATTLEKELHQGAEGLWPLRVSLQDESLNESVIANLAGDDFVAIDFTPPTAECGLIPVPDDAGYAIGQKVMVQITALEELPSNAVPVLLETLDPPVDGNYFLFEEGTKYRFSHMVTENDGEHSFAVGASLVDLAGNMTPVGVSACNSGAFLVGIVDGTAPQVLAFDIQVDGGAVDPKITPLSKDRLVEVTVVVKNTANKPNVLLGAVAMDAPDGQPVDQGNGTYSWLFTRTIDSDCGEGLLDVVVSGKDDAGNGYDHVEIDAVKTDFTGPTVTCSLFPSVAAKGEAVTLTVGVSEAVQPFAVSSPEFELALTSNPAESPMTWVFAGEVNKKGTTIVGAAYALGEVRDMAGNPGIPGPGCSGTFTVDAVAPLIENVQVSTDPVIVDSAGNTVLRVAMGGNIILSFDVVDAGGMDDFPVVWLDAGSAADIFTLKEFTSNEETGVSTYKYGFGVNPLLHDETLEGSWPLRTTFSDAAGNTTFEGSLGDTAVAVDFTPPLADCSLIPDPGDAPYGIGREITLVVSPLEELALNSVPLLTESFAPVLGQTFFTFQENTEYRFSGTMGEWDKQGSFGATVRLTDLVGNQTDVDADACISAVSGVAWDTVRPTLAKVTFLVDDGGWDVDAPLRAGRVVEATIDVVDTPVEPLVTLAGSAFTAQSAMPVDLGDSYRWVFQRTLDGTELEGSSDLVVSGIDEAGNAWSDTWDAQPLVLDFGVPYVQCFANLSAAKAGDRVTVSAVFSEPVLESVELDATGIDLVLDEAESSPLDSNPVYVFDFEVPVGMEKTTWTAAVLAQDIAGNPDPQISLCATGGTIDGKAIEVSKTSVHAQVADPDNPGQVIATGTRARSDAEVVIGFTLSEAPATGSLEVRVGETLVTDLSVESLTYTFTHPLQGQASSGQVLPVTVAVEDDAGNYTFESIGTVVLDYDAPGLASAATFGRCDNLATARIGQDSLWVKGDWDASCLYEYIGDQEPEPDCAEAAADSAAPVKFTFALNEAIDIDRLTVYVGSPDSPATIARCESNASFVTAYFLPLGNEIESIATDVHAQVSDLAGNAVTLTLGQLYFDYTRPTPPAVSEAGRIVYTRIPWGINDSTHAWHTKGAKRFSLRGSAGAVEGGTYLKVYDGLDPAESGVIGSAQADDGGAFGAYSTPAEMLVLNAGDQPHIYLVATDAAGNASDMDEDPGNGLQASLVRDIEWVATFGHKKAQNTISNPHEFSTSSWYQSQVLQEDADEWDAGTGIDERTGQGASTSGVHLEWRKVAPISYPAGRNGHALCYDPVRGRVVLFGGDTGGATSDTWEWDGVAWKSISTLDPQLDGDPPARAQARCAYDTRRGRILLFGGALGNEEYYDDFWSYDGTSWARISSANPGEDGEPPARSQYGMVYDTARERLILFGGRNGNGRLSDLWEWDGTNWTLVTPEDPEGDGNPGDAGGRISGPAMAYDPLRQVTVLHGGQGSKSPGETWEWDGTSWALITPADVLGDGSPGQVENHTMEYHDTLGKVVLLAPGDNWGLNQEIWSWDGTEWMHHDTSDPEGDGDAIGAYRSPAAYDAAHDEIIFFGGQLVADEEHGGNTWRWDGASWRSSAKSLGFGNGLTVTPPGRANHQMVYDVNQKRVFMFAGYGGGYLSDSWLWNGSTWQKKYMADPENDGHACAVFSHGMTYANGFGDGKVVTYSGQKPTDCAYWSKDQLVWMSDGNSWEKAHINQSTWAQPEAKTADRLTYDSVRNRVVMYRPTVSDGGVVWELYPNGTSYTWEKNMVPLLENQYGSATAAFDVEREITVITNGNCGTYEWDGTNLSAIQLTSDLPESGYNCLAYGDSKYDPVRGKVIAIGGSDKTTSSSSNLALEWDGANWTELTTGDPGGDGNPEPRQGHGFAHDGGRGELVLFGGWDMDDSTWRGKWAIDGRPGHVATFRLAGAGHCQELDLQSVAVRWSAGGVSQGVSPADGASLYGWQQGRWGLLDSNTAALDAPGVIEWTETSPEVLDHMAFGDLGSLAFSVVPRGVNGLGLAKVSTDYVMATVSYRLTPDAPEQCEN